MAKKVAGTLATNIGVNTTNAVTSIESLKIQLKIAPMLGNRWNLK